MPLTHAPIVPTFRELNNEIKTFFNFQTRPQETPHRSPEVLKTAHG